MPLTERRIKAVTRQLRIDSAEEAAIFKKGHPYPVLDMLLGRVDFRMLSAEATKDFLDRLTSLTGGNLDKVTERTVAAAIEWTFTNQAHKLPSLQINGKSITKPFAIEAGSTGKEREEKAQIITAITDEAKRILLDKWQ